MGPRRSSPGCAGVAVLLLTLALGWVLRPGAARAFAGGEEGGWSLQASFRSLGGIWIAGEKLPAPGGEDTAVEDPDRASSFGQQLGRLEWTGQPTATFGYELHLLQALATRTGTASPSAGAGGLPVAPRRYRALDLSWQPLDERQSSISSVVDRASVRLSLGPADVTLGRQAISFGHAFFWNPTDIFLAFDPQQVDQEYKPGVDALRLDLALGDFSGLSLIAVTGEALDMQGERVGNGRLQVSSYGSALVARAHTSLSSWALSLQAGAVHGGFQAGGGFTTDLLGLDLRGEFTFYQPRSATRAQEHGFDGALSPRALRAVVGLGYRFESSLQLRTAYFLQWLDAKDDLQLDLRRFASGLSLTPGRHTLGGLVGYEITPLLRAQLFAGLCLQDGSAQLQPLLVYSVSDEAELLAGALAHLGRRGRGGSLETSGPRSAYGSFPSGGFFEFKLYF